jgi:uroporphyrinogen-III synthase
MLRRMTQSSLKVVSLESRHAPEMLRLLERYGCEPISAPSLREVPLADQDEVFAFGEELLRGEHEVLMLLTGVGTRMLVDALGTRHDRASVIAALAQRKLVCRGPKPVAVVKSFGLRPTLVAPEPNTWVDLLKLLDDELPVSGRSVAVQAYGRLNEELLEGLRERGAKVRSVAIYAWALPLDIAPLTAAVAQLAEASVDVVLFTSAQQVEHLYLVAEQTGREQALSSALRTRVVCASIGPITSDALARRGIEADVTAAHPKMGQLVQAIARDAPQALARKRRV